MDECELLSAGKRPYGDPPAAGGPPAAALRAAGAFGSLRLKNDMSAASCCCVRKGEREVSGFEEVRVNLGT